MAPRKGTLTALAASCLVALLAVGVAVGMRSQEKPANSPASAEIQEELLVEAPPDEPRKRYKMPGVGGEVWTSPDARQVVWTAKRKAGWVVVVNGRAGPAYKEVGAPRFSPDGRRLAYAAKRSDNLWVMVVDHQELSGDYDGIGHTFYVDVVVPAAPGGVRTFAHEDQRPVFSPDGGRMAFIASRGKQKLVVLDDQPGPLCDRIYPPLTFSPDGQRLGYVGARSEKLVLVIDQVVQTGEFWEPFAVGEGALRNNMAGVFAFSPDSQHVFHVGRREGGDWMVVRDQEPVRSLPCQRFGAIVFSPDGQHIACVAQTAP